jgi:DNA polymerase III alpha subunit (gram-positive type)
MVIFGVIDTETTGLGKFNRYSPRHDDFAISIGLVIADADLDAERVKCMDCLYSLIRIPDPARSKDTFHIHGISEDRVASAPVPQDVCTAILRMQELYGFDVAGAWNHRFDRYFVDRMFSLSEMEKPKWDWLEMQPVPYAKLDHHVQSVSHEDVRSMPGHNALFDSVRALGVFAHRKGFELDISPIKCKL